MKIYKAYKFRMYPNNEIKSKINSFMGTSRFIYNYYLDKKDRYYNELKINYNIKDMKKDVKYLSSNYEWLKEVDSCILRTTIDDLDRSYTNFFEKKSDHPKYKSRNNHDTYRTVAIRSSYKENDYCNIKVDLEKRIIKLPKLPNIKIRGYRNLKTFNDKKIINVTISKEANKYYASVLVEENIVERPFILNKAVGIDLGVKNLVITSDGIKYNAMKKIELYEKKIKGLNKWLSRCEKGSKNREKVKIKLQRVYQKLRNARKYYCNIITNEIVKENDLIVTETLSIKEMIENSQYKTFRKKIIDSSLNEIKREIRYKSKWQNKRLIELNKYYASSQICNHCGNKNKEIKDLSIREWECNNCYNKNDRDINASLNIEYEGIIKYYKEQYEN